MRIKSESLQSTVRRNVKAARLKRGLSQEELARSAGLHARYISRLETTDQNVTLEILESLAGALGLEAAELLGKSEVEASVKDLRLLENVIKELEIFRSRVRTSNE